MGNKVCRVLAGLWLVSSVLLVGSARAGNIYYDPAVAKYPASGYAIQTNDTAGTLPLTTIKYPSGVTSAAYFPSVYPSDAPYPAGCTAGAPSPAPWACCTGNGTGCTAPLNVTLWMHGAISSGNPACLRVSVLTQITGRAWNTWAAGGSLSASLNSFGTANSQVTSGVAFFGLTPGDTQTGGSSPANIKVERVTGLGGCTDTYGNDVFVDWVNESY